MFGAGLRATSDARTRPICDHEQAAKNRRPKPNALRRVRPKAKKELLDFHADKPILLLGLTHQAGHLALGSLGAAGVPLELEH